MPLNLPNWLWYDDAGRDLGISPQKVAALVKEHNLPHKRVYGNMAVERASWEALVVTLKTNPPV